MSQSARSKSSPLNSSLHPSLKEFLERASLVVVNKEDALKLSWTCILASGHLLIEDLPGRGKTTMVKVIARLLDLPWKRIQCTNDLLPADITGGNVYDNSSAKFTFHPGPLFSHLVMADELNRASPKSQSAFLQAMEEGNITVDGKTYFLPQPFVMIATQNPLDSAGTNPLPESQLDRFMMSISLGLPGREGERQLLMDTVRHEKINELEPVTSLSELKTFRESVFKIHIADRVATYVLDIADYVRQRSDGFSPRCSVALISAAKAWAFGHQRSFVIPDDVKAVINAVISHRLVVHASSNASPHALIADALREILPP